MTEQPSERAEHEDFDAPKTHEDDLEATTLAEIRPGRATQAIRLLGAAAQTRTLQVTLVVIILSTGAIVGALAHENSQPIEWGDEVRFHLSMMDEDGTILMTTNRDIAARAIENGNNELVGDLEAPIYQGARAYMHTRGLPDDGEQVLSMTQLLIGRSAGDVVLTPFMQQPFGPHPTGVVPFQIGPVKSEAVLNLEHLYGDERREDTIAKYGPREELAVGMHLAYTPVVDAIIVELDDEAAKLELLLPEDQDTVFSRTFGFDMGFQRMGDEVLLLPELKVGEEFETRPCNLPQDILRPGTYRVTGIGEDGYHVEQTHVQRPYLYDRPIQIQIEVLEVEKGSGVHGWLPAALEPLGQLAARIN